MLAVEGIDDPETCCHAWMCKNCTNISFTKVLLLPEVFQSSQRGKNERNITGESIQ